MQSSRTLSRVACFDFESDGAHRYVHTQVCVCVFHTNTNRPELCASPLLFALGQRARQCTGGLAGSFSPLKSWRKKTNSRHVGLGCGDLPRTPRGRRHFSTMMYELSPSPCCTFPCLFVFLHPPFFALFPSFSLIDLTPQCLRCFSN